MQLFCGFAECWLPNHKTQCSTNGLWKGKKIHTKTQTHTRTRTHNRGHGWSRPFPLSHSAVPRFLRAELACAIMFRAYQVFLTTSVFRKLRWAQWTTSARVRLARCSVSRFVSEGCKIRLHLNSRLPTMKYQIRSLNAVQWIQTERSPARWCGAQQAQPEHKRT